MTDIRNVKCGQCKVALEVVTEPHGKIARCPRCGTSDTLDNVIREVGEYAKEQAAQHLEKKMASIARGSKFMKFTPAHRPKKRHRFIVDVNF